MVAARRVGCAETWMDLEIVILSKIRQTQTITIDILMVSFICGLKDISDLQTVESWIQKTNIRLPRHKRKR